MAIPSINFSAVSGSGLASRQDLVRQVRDARENHGFFQLTRHGMPESLLDAALEQSQDFFSLPLEVKGEYDKNIGGYNRGYERLRAQNFEKKKTAGDLKEGYYFGMDLSEDHPMVKSGKFNMGPNKYPEDVTDAAKFQLVIDQYFNTMRELGEKIVRIICDSLEVEDSWVSEFVETPIAILRLLHYPPQAPNTSNLGRGFGARTDFGAITILPQDMVGGLQVCVLVVDLGNVMVRWTNDRYLSNLHRVINKSGRERYSIPFFFSGNPDFLVKCFSNYHDTKEGAKYEPVTVEEWIAGRYADTYGSSQSEAVGELSVAEATAASS